MSIEVLVTEECECGSQEFTVDTSVYKFMVESPHVDCAECGAPIYPHYRKE